MNDRVRAHDPAADPEIDPGRLPPHVFRCRVYYEDTDAAGIVYYANYLRFAERARTEALREGGSDHSRIFAETGVALVVRRCTLDYLAPARLDDLLEVETRVVAVRGATLDLAQTVRCGGRDLVRIEVRLVAMTRDGRPTRIPASVRAVLAGQATPDTQNASNHQDRGMDHHG